MWLRLMSAFNQVIGVYFDSAYMQEKEENNFLPISRCIKAEADIETFETK